MAAWKVLSQETLRLILSFLKEDQEQDPLNLHWICSSLTCFKYNHYFNKLTNLEEKSSILNLLSSNLTMSA